MYKQTNHIVPFKTHKKYAIWSHTLKENLPFCEQRHNLETKKMFSIMKFKVIWYCLVICTFCKFKMIKCHWFSNNITKVDHLFISFIFIHPFIVFHIRKSSQSYNILFTNSQSYSIIFTNMSSRYNKLNNHIIPFIAHHKINEISYKNYQ